MRPPTARPRLPTEILDTIFANLSKNHLEPLLVANAFVSTVATRRLYQNVTLARPAAVVAFLRTILANPRLPPLVRSLDINMTKARDADEGHAKARPTGNFYALLSRALRATTALTALALELPKAHAPLWIFAGCTFRLRQFTTSMYCRRPLARFLETQASLEELTLRGYPTDAVFALAPEALPRLRAFNAVHADAALIRAVVQGRPVRVVSVPLFPEMSLASLDALRAGTAPLLRLSVISFDPTAPGFLFEALAQRFQELEALHLVMLMAEYNQELLEQSAAVLSNFKRLKYITFMAAPTRPAAPALDAAEADIAKRWHRHCPTLRTIILPKGRVWFQNAPEVPPGVSAGAAAVAAALAGAGAETEESEDDDIEDWDAEEGGHGGGMDMPVLSFSMEHGVQEVPGGAQPVVEEWAEL
ncbi:hypothetical protein HYPSUDRAFT_146620 [Hypholoma sublateritium FD-334 SS-4]|uniref:F-box domain-containing protein n=1 Tax=Hypholoma sublateritium (strain FD-334 SS-4) TaxID=945553 RepID=A0A0D2M2H2_HYPSF|nr:hypothetical protein HYPSUDRAFT_146620 [Hypholoma sublateritium FD-334 SS-4]